MTTQTDVLIIGAGPSGLVLALWLTRQNVNVRIIDRQESKPSTSRALVIHARTIELYRQLGLADDVVANGHKVEATNIWAQGSHRAHVPIGDVGKGLTPYPFLQIYPQDFHERLLEERLNAMGVTVQRNWALVDLTEHEDHVSARLQHAKDSADTTDEERLETTCTAKYIVGCDGAHSTLRHACNIDFAGATYPQLFYVADVEGSGPTMNGQAHVTVNGTEFMLSFAYDDNRRARLSGAVDEARLTKELSDLTVDDVAPTALQAMRLHIDKVNWFTTYRVHHRVAASFQKGRAFLVGDAAHIHSPVGGQGMNTGIGDAINLAWKLSAVLQGRADASLLASYDAERHAFANILVSTTDRAFTTLVSKGYVAGFLRTWFVPTIMPYLTRLTAVRHRIFQGVSQILVNYRESALSAGTAGSVQGGDRMPWAPVGDLDNFDSLKEITWQVHVYGAAKPELEEWCRAKGIPLHGFPWDAKYQGVGLGQDAAYLIRPDTYIAVAEPSGLPENFDKYLAEHNLRMT
ncbi:putative FAD binding monooxygenase [Aspergillus clavatus NRRL 1]|uniref:FAD binding monooxygenase, putative n=1 Tax=Aspergillus clavatus (strain ATCC 1007 / CBS 513.65 / DSM 816 / NCTC 3887 / NRRL 1 / QM 1276 / 107) TaxID=344612 RepID=A1CC98_ASPCL|nr:FAD binding monooxygenase, putative [Aspergillus clavatus NRRL 1]EAW12155.1 FAD binding monooxygenase, putative [Aspergillus clavatus NRRL 1]